VCALGRGLAFPQNHASGRDSMLRKIFSQALNIFEKDLSWVKVKIPG